MPTITIERVVPAGDETQETATLTDGCDLHVMCAAPRELSANTHRQRILLSAPSATPRRRFRRRERRIRQATPPSKRAPLSTLLATADTLRARRLSSVPTTSKTTTPVVLPQATLAIEGGASAPSKTPTLPEGPNPTLAPSPPRHAHVLPATLSAWTVSRRCPSPPPSCHVYAPTTTLIPGRPAGYCSFSWMPSRRRHARGPWASEYEEGGPPPPSFLSPAPVDGMNIGIFLEARRPEAYVRHPRG
ncbi:hypothetical protein EV715DRAFT_298121 [Schizophyllum commune]